MEMKIVAANSFPFGKGFQQGGGWKGGSYPSPVIMQTTEAQALPGLRFLVLL